METKTHSGQLSSAEEKQLSRIRHTKILVDKAVPKGIHIYVFGKYAFPFLIIPLKVYDTVISVQ